MKKSVLSVSGSSPEDRIKLGSRCGTVNIILNLLLFAVKLAGGIISHSVSVLADAINNLSDTSASLVSLWGFRISGAKADDKHPYGHARAEYISALGVAVLIILIGFELLKSSAAKIFSPAPVSFTPFVLGSLIFSVTVKLIMFFYNSLIGRAINSALLKATAKDALNDCFTTSGVLAGGIIVYFTKIDLDGYIGCAVAAFILVNGVKLIKETIDPLLGAAPDPGLVASIREKILTYRHVIDAHDLIIHDYGPSRRFASVHVEMPSELTIIDCHDIIDSMEQDFAESYGISLIVHLDPVESSGTEYSLRKKIEKIALSIHPDCTIHDLRINDKSIVFDCVKPAACHLSDEAVADIFATQLKVTDPYLKVSVTVDSGFAPVQNF